MIIPEFGFGGAEKSFSALSVELSKKYDLTVVVFNLLRKPSYPVGGKIVSLNIDSGLSNFQKSINFIRRINRLKKIKNKLCPQVSISFLEGADYINTLSRRNEEKIILSIRGSKIHDQNIRGLIGFIRHKILIPFIYKKADNLISLNYGIKNELINNYKINNPIEVIHNWIETDQIKGLAEEELEERLLSIFTNSPVLVSHSRLAKEKGYEYMLDIFANILKNHPNTKYVIIGEGEQKSNLIDKCKSLGITFWVNKGLNEPQNKNVYFLGYQPNPIALINRASIYVLPSLHEGFGNSLLEAMACSLPVVASDCPYGPAEILVKNKEKAKYGILLDIPKNEQAIELWSNKISELLNNKVMQEKLGIKSLVRAKQFNKSDILEKWESLIEN